MRLADQLLTVRLAFAANRARAALTLLGIVIGAGSIVLLAGLLKGGEEALISTSQRANEADMIQVRRDEPPPQQAGRTRRELSRVDGETLEESRLLAGARVATEATRDGRALWRERKKRVRVVSAGADALGFNRLELLQGRGLTVDDLKERRAVCVIGYDVWHDLLEEQPSAPGTMLRIDDQMWTVVGVLKRKPPLGGGGGGLWMWDRKVLVPETTFDALYDPRHEVGRLYVRLSGTGSLAKMLRTVEGVVDQTLLRRHLGVKNYKVEGEEGFANQERLILMIIKLLLLGTGLLSLFVGGINIMNIMLVTVTERTREIGIRRAVGASPAAILGQFLLEAAAIASVGGITGVSGGVALSWLASRGLSRLVGHWPFYVESWSVVLGLALSISTGIVFGLFPAWRASRLDPVEALRQE